MLLIRQRPLGSFDACDLIPTQYIPGIREIVERVGCTPAAMALASAELIKQASPASGGPAPPWAQIVAAIGPQVVAGCICKKAQPPTSWWGGMSTAWYTNPWILGGIGLGGLMLILLLRRPAPVIALPPAAPTK